MMRKISVLVMCLFVSLVMAESHELFTLNWGEERDEVTLTDRQESDIMGAVSFTIGEDGMIYVPEALREEILVYDRDGEFKKAIPLQTRINQLAVDSSGYIFTRSDRGIVSVYSQERKSKDGNLVEQYQLEYSPDLIEGYGQEIHLEGSETDAVRDVGVHMLDGFTKPVFTLDKSGSQVRTEQADSGVRKRGRPGSDGKQYRSYWQDDQTGVVEIYDQSATLMREFEVPLKDEGRLGVFLFKGVDEDGNIFLERERIVDRQAHLEIVVVNSEGEILETLEIPNDYYSTVYKKTHLHDGKIYQMQTTRRGIQFSAWEVLQ